MIEFLVGAPRPVPTPRRSPSLGLRLNSNSTIEATNPPWLRLIEKRVNALLNFPENWDSYGASRVSCECVMAAFSLVLSNVIHETPAPQFIPTSQGGIQVEWHTGGVDFELVFNPNESARYYHSDSKGIEIEGEVSFDPSLVGSLLRDLPKRNELVQNAR